MPGGGRAMGRGGRECKGEGNVEASRRVGYKRSEERSEDEKKDNYLS